MTKNLPNPYYTPSSLRSLGVIIFGHKLPSETEEIKLNKKQFNFRHVSTPVRPQPHQGGDKESGTSSKMHVCSSLSRTYNNSRYQGEYYYLNIILIN